MLVPDRSPPMPLPFLSLKSCEKHQACCLFLTLLISHADRLYSLELQRTLFDQGSGDGHRKKNPKQTLELSISSRWKYSCLQKRPSYPIAVVLRVVPGPTASYLKDGFSGPRPWGWGLPVFVFTSHPGDSVDNHWLLVSSQASIKNNWKHVTCCFLTKAPGVKFKEDSNLWKSLHCGVLRCAVIPSWDLLVLYVRGERSHWWGTWKRAP